MKANGHWDLRFTLPSFWTPARIPPQGISLYWNYVLCAVLWILFMWCLGWLVLIFEWIFVSGFSFIIKNIPQKLYLMPLYWYTEKQTDATHIEWNSWRERTFIPCWGNHKQVFFRLLKSIYVKSITRNIECATGSPQNERAAAWFPVLGQLSKWD